VREIGCMFMVLTFLAGITVSTVPVALINVVVFFALSLGMLHLFGERLGKQGTAFGLLGTFFASFAWPFALVPFLGDEDCEGDQCLAWVFTTPGAQMTEEEPQS
jgi:drug/metabolite transporter (DMT)-like permease